MKFQIVAMLLATPLGVQAQASTGSAKPTSVVNMMAMAPALMEAAPAVGTMAPDFTAQGADMSGTHTVSLKQLRGQVVVLAFYPLDRSSGCTHELKKFRDEYTTIFGSGVTVLPISEDSVASHVSWAHDARFPFTLVSDKGGNIANQYGSMMTGRPYASRTVFVIGKDGRILNENMKFGALDQHAYDALTAAVAKAKTE